MSSSTVQQIKDKLSIVDVVGSYIKTEKAGANYKARCPFHNEKTPSFFISPSRNSYYCFGCAMKGDIFTFVQDFEKVDFLGALKILAERAGVPIVNEKPEVKTERDRLFSVLEEATKFFEKNLEFTKDGEEGGVVSVAGGGESNNVKSAKKYLLSRGLTEETITDWRLGYASPEWRLLLENLKGKGYSESDMEKVGLIKKAEPKEGGISGQGISNQSGHAEVRYYDRFRGRVIFPLFDPSGRVIGYSGRILDDNGKEAKYLNSPDTPLFNKSEILYGYHKAKHDIRKRDYSLLVEGQMDLLMSHQSGFTNTVASSGTALTLDHLIKLNQISSNLMIAYDADRAGLSASLRAWANALSLGMEVKIVSLPAGEDPASLILEDSDKWKNCLRSAKHIIDFYLGILIEENRVNPDERKLWKEVEKKVLPYVRVLPSAIQRSHFISRISDATDIPIKALTEELEKIQANESETKNGTSGYVDRQTSGFQNESDKKAAQDDKEKNIGSLSNHPSLKRLKAIIAWKSDEEVRKSLESILDSAGLRDLLIINPDDKAELAVEAEVVYEGMTDLLLKEDIESLLYRLEEDVIKDRLSKSMTAMHHAEKENNADKMVLLRVESDNLFKQLSALQKKLKSG